MQAQVLRAADIDAIVRYRGVDAFMDELIERIQSAFAAFDASRTDVADRTGFYYDAPNPGLLEWMPLHQAQQDVLMKRVGYQFLREHSGDGNERAEERSFASISQNA